MSNLFKGTSIYLLSNIINLIIPFLLLPILTRYLTPAEYGQMAMFLMVVSGFSAFVGLSVHGASSRKYFDFQNDKLVLSEFNASCLQILTISALFFLLFVNAFKDELVSYLNIPERWLYSAVFISYAFFIIELRLSQWQIRNKAKEYGLLQVTRSLLNMLLSLIFVIVMFKGVEGRIEAMIITAFMFSTISLYLLYKDKLVVFKSWNLSYIKEALTFGVPLIPHIVGAFLLISIDRFFINKELGLEKTGIFMIAVQFSLVLSVFFDSINKAYVPWLFERLKRDDETEKKQIVRMTYLYFILVFVLAGLAFVIGPYFVVLIAGDNYKESGEIIGWLCLGQCIRGLYLMVTNYIFYSKKTSILSFITITTGTFNIIFLIFLLKEYGLRGAGYASVLSMTILFLSTWYFANRSHPMPWLSFTRHKSL
ncbi:MAG: O-antigen/teichoic acid export membrane protein [Cognaticolwellia sp.]|jgi:O-antigen/teichoic acid export membrane protein